MRSKLMGRISLFAAVLAAIAVLGPFSSVSQAWIVTHDGVTIFSDDQESEGVGAEMVAEVGSYGYVGTTSPLLITGDSSGEASGGPGAAFNGDNYNRKSRNASPATHQQEAVFEGGAITTGVLNAKIAYWQPSTDDWNSIAIFDNRVGEGENAGETYSYILYHPSNTSEYWSDDKHGDGSGSTGALINVDAWNTMEIILDFNNLTTEVITNGVSGGAYAVASPVPVGRIYWRNEGGGGDKTLYTDAIPEPASLILMGVGGLMLLSRRRREA